jgi:hypothetical protein
MNNVVPTLIAAFALLQLGGNAIAQSREFRCDDQTVLKVKALNATTLAAGPIEGRTVALKQSPQQPLTYTYGQNRLDIAQDQRSVRLTVSGGSPMNCVWQGSNATASAGDSTQQGNTGGETANASPPASDRLGDMKFESWGGVVRSGPGMDYRKLASLEEGDPITLLEQTDVDMNGYPWFKIRYGGNKTGYQWGGIICPVGQPYPGTFEQCR